MLASNLLTHERHDSRFAGRHDLYPHQHAGSPGLPLHYENCTYRRCELGRLSGLPALLTNWRKRCAEGGDVVRGEATVKLGAAVARGANLGAHGVAERERFFAGGAKAPRTSRIGHVYYKYTASQESARESSGAWKAGTVGAVVQCGGSTTLAPSRFTRCGRRRQERRAYTITLTRGTRPLWPRRAELAEKIVAGSRMRSDESVRREWWSLQEARADTVYRGFAAKSRRKKRWTEGNATRISRQSQRYRGSYRTMVTMWTRSDAPRRGNRRTGPWGRLAPSCSHIESSDEAST